MNEMNEMNEMGFEKEYQRQKNVGGEFVVGGISVLILLISSFSSFCILYFVF
jgi:hypothetical protein